MIPCHKIENNNVDKQHRGITEEHQRLDVEPEKVHPRIQVRCKQERPDKVENFKVDR
jgi:hypothetical protein